MNRQAWLDGLKAGDPVLIRLGDGNIIGAFAVERRTDTGGVHVLSTAYDDAGIECEDATPPRETSTLVEPTPDAMAAHALRIPGNRLACVKWQSEPTDDQIRAVAAILWPDAQPAATSGGR